MTEFGLGLFCVSQSGTYGFSRVHWVNLVLKGDFITSSV